jgi:hypothetical protein
MSALLVSSVRVVPSMPIVEVHNDPLGFLWVNTIADALPVPIA